MRGSAFSEIYSKVIPAVCVVVAAMLAMQGGLSVIKFKSMAAQATASQMQVVGSTIESSLLRWEQLGLGIAEMERLPELIMREATQSAVIDRIAILNPVGNVVQATAELAILDADRAAILRRILSANEAETVIERRGWIYSGRMITGSTGDIIGAVVMVAPTSLFMPMLVSLGQNIGWTYLMIALSVPALVLPVVMYQFRGFASLYLVLRDMRAGHVPAQSAVHPDMAGLVAKLQAGHAVDQDVRAKVDVLAKDVLKDGAA